MTFNYYISWALSGRFKFKNNIPRFLSFVVFLRAGIKPLGLAKSIRTDVCNIRIRAIPVLSSYDCFRKSRSYIFSSHTLPRSCCIGRKYSCFKVCHNCCFVLVRDAVNSS